MVIRTDTVRNRFNIKFLSPDLFEMGRRRPAVRESLQNPGLPYMREGRNVGLRTAERKRLSRPAIEAAQVRRIEKWPQWHVTMGLRPLINFSTIPQCAVPSRRRSARPACALRPSIGMMVKMRRSTSSAGADGSSKVYSTGVGKSAERRTPREGVLTVQSCQPLQAA